MASRELPWALSRLTARCPRRVANTTALSGRRFASSEASNAPDVVTDLEELEPQSSFSATNYSTQKIEAFDPAKRAKGRKRELPPSRYVTNGCGRVVTQAPSAKFLPATNFDLRDSIEDLSIPTNHRQRLILRPGSLCLGPSRGRVSNRRTSQQLPPIS